MSKHTPGPWTFVQFTKADGSPIQTVEDVAEVMVDSALHSDRCELFGVALDDAAAYADGLPTVVCYTGNGPNAHNNARLIAAAPDLLAALRTAEDDLAPYYEHETDETGHATPACIALERIRQAIAKAERRQA